MATSFTAIRAASTFPTYEGKGGGTLQCAYGSVTFDTDVTLAADLTVTTVKGSAAYERPTTAIGNAYIEWQETEPADQTRISATVSTWAITFRLIVITGNEIDLWAMVDSMKTMIALRTEATISSARHKVRWTAISRAEPSENTIEALRYAAVTQVLITR